MRFPHPNAVFLHRLYPRQIALLGCALCLSACAVSPGGPGLAGTEIINLNGSTIGVGDLGQLYERNRGNEESGPSNWIPANIPLFESALSRVAAPQSLPSGIHGSSNQVEVRQTGGTKSGNITRSMGVTLSAPGLSIGASANWLLRYDANIDASFSLTSELLPTEEGRDYVIRHSEDLEFAYVRSVSIGQIFRRFSEEIRFSLFGLLADFQINGEYYDNATSEDSLDHGGILVTLAPVTKLQMESVEPAQEKGGISLKQVLGEVRNAEAIKKDVAEAFRDQLLNASFRPCPLTDQLEPPRIETQLTCFYEGEGCGIKLQSFDLPENARRIRAYSSPDSNRGVVDTWVFVELSETGEIVLVAGDKDSDGWSSYTLLDKKGKPSRCFIAAAYIKDDGNMHEGGGGRWIVEVDDLGVVGEFNFILYDRDAKSVTFPSVYRTLIGRQELTFDTVEISSIRTPRQAVTEAFGKFLEGWSKSLYSQIDQTGPAQALNKTVLELIEGRTAGRWAGFQATNVSRDIVVLSLGRR